MPYAQLKWGSAWGHTGFLGLDLGKAFCGILPHCSSTRDSAHHLHGVLSISPKVINNVRSSNWTDFYRVFNKWQMHMILLYSFQWHFFFFCCLQERSRWLFEQKFHILGRQSKPNSQNDTLKRTYYNMLEFMSIFGHKWRNSPSCTIEKSLLRLMLKIFSQAASLEDKIIDAQLWNLSRLKEVQPQNAKEYEKIN